MIRGVCHFVGAISAIALCASAGAQHDPYEPGAPAPGASATNPSTNIDATSGAGDASTFQGKRDYDNTGFQDEVRAYLERQQALGNAQNNIVGNPTPIERDVRGPARYDVYPPGADERYDLSTQPGTTVADTARRGQLGSNLGDEMVIENPAMIERGASGPARYDQFPPSAQDRYDYTNDAIGNNVPVSPSDINTSPDTATSPNAPRLDAQRMNTRAGINAGTRYDIYAGQSESLTMGPPSRYDVYPNQGVADRRTPVNVPTYNVPNRNVPSYNARAYDNRAYNVPSQDARSYNVPSYNLNTTRQVPNVARTPATRRDWRQEDFNVSPTRRSTATMNTQPGGNVSQGGAGAASGSAGPSDGTGGGSN